MRTAPASPKGRLLLGKQRGLAHQERVYRAADYLEIDLVESYDVTRRRIFYDEIQLVTIHSSIGWGTAVTAGILGGVLGIASGGMLNVDKSAALFFFLVGCLPLLVLAAWRLLVPAEVVTVFGKRARTQMRFWPFRTKGRDAYLLVGRLARERQAQLARRAQRPAPGLPTEPAGPSS